MKFSLGIAVISRKGKLEVRDEILRKKRWGSSVKRNLILDEEKEIGEVEFHEELLDKKKSCGEKLEEDEERKAQGEDERKEKLQFSDLLAKH